jgi:hypothetical protein
MARIVAETDRENDLASSFLGVIHRPAGSQSGGAPRAPLRSVASTNGAANRVTAPTAPESGGALSGLEVVEVASAIAGSFATKLLADRGAHVTKVEPLKGAAYRNRSLSYDTANSEAFVCRFRPYDKRKPTSRSISRSKRGRDSVGLTRRGGCRRREHARWGDGAAGFGWGQLHERNPELIYCSITGHGEDGPYWDWPAVDTAVQAVASWTDQIGVRDQPEIINVFATNHMTALCATVGVLTVIVKRSMSDVG